MFSKDINKIAKAGITISIALCTVIGAFLISKAIYGSYGMDYNLLLIGVAVILGGIMTSALTWGVVGCLSDIGIEMRRNNELMEEILINMAKKE